MTTMICGPICKCSLLVVKINLFKPQSVEEINGFMKETAGVCIRQASDYWDMRALQINWGTSSEVLTVHRLAVDSIIQKVTDDIPF